MGVETIVESIRSEAAAQVAAIESERDRTIARIVEDAQARADAERQTWSESRDEEALRRRAGIVNLARLEADRRLAEVREELFQRALARVRGMLDELTREPRYEEVFAALYEEAVDIVPDDDATVLVRPEDREVAGRIVAESGRSGAVDATRPCIGGLDIEIGDGRSVRNTFDSRLALSERRLRSLAVATIPDFAGSGVGP